VEVQGPTQHRRKRRGGGGLNPLYSCEFNFRRADTRVDGGKPVISQQNMAKSINIQVGRKLL